MNETRPNMPPAAGHVRMVPERFGWSVSASVGLIGETRYVLGSQKRAERIGRAMVNKLLEDQRRSRAAIEFEVKP